MATLLILITLSLYTILLWELAIKDGYWALRTILIDRRVNQLSQRIQHQKKITQLKHEHIGSIPAISQWKRIAGILIAAASTVGLIYTFEKQIIQYLKLNEQGNWLLFAPSLNLLVSLLILFCVWLYRDINRITELNTQRKDTNLKEFQQLQQWATGNIDTATADADTNKNARLTLQISSLHSLRPFLKGVYGQDFRRSTFEIYAAILQQTHTRILKKTPPSKEEKILNTTAIQEAIQQDELAKQINRIVAEEWFSFLINHDFPTQHLSLLGVEFPNNCYLRHRHFDDQLNLSHADLRLVVLNHTDLTNADLRAANLTNADLYKANLTNADLRAANLTNADLRAANLTSAYLSEANLTNADLRAANLTSAYLSEANLTNADLRYAKLTNADLRAANLTSAYLSEANLTNADLRYAKLTNANLSDADLTNAKLNDAKLTSAYLSDANLTNATLNKANLTNAYLRDADLTNADLSEANLTNATLNHANLTSAYLSEAKLTSADLQFANLTNANLHKANLTNATLNHANLTSAYLSEANLIATNLHCAQLIAADLSGATLEAANLYGIRLNAATCNHNTCFIGCTIDNEPTTIAHGKDALAHYIRALIGKATDAQALPQHKNLTEEEKADAIKAIQQWEGPISHLLHLVRLNKQEYEQERKKIREERIQRVQSDNPFDWSQVRLEAYDAARAEEIIAHSNLP